MDMAISIPNNAENPFTMENGIITSDRAYYDGSDHHLDYMMNGDYDTYTLNNTQETAYLITFSANTNNPGAKVNFVIKNESNEEVYNQSVDIAEEGWGNWTGYEAPETGVLPAGKYTFIVTPTSEADNNTTANINDILFTATTSTAIQTVKAAGEAERAIFNVAGQRMAKASKGLYIVNGKKVVLK